MMIDCVSPETILNFYPIDLITEQFRLRHREVILKEKWRDVCEMGNKEFDDFDTPATEYFVARNKDGKVIGVVRTNPTTMRSMLRDKFNYLVTGKVPEGHDILDCSRMVLDRSELATKEQRKPVVQALVLAVQERGLQRDMRAHIGFMMPKIWASTFVGAGWDVKWLGPERQLAQGGDIVRAAYMPISEVVRDNIRRVSGITGEILNFGSGKPDPLPVAFHLHAEHSR
jgi:N-acyl-L-homoserine lactone synthetase